MSSPENTPSPDRGPRRRGSTDAYVERGHYFLMHADGVPPIGHYSDLHDGLMLYPDYSGDEGSGVYIRTGTFFGSVEITVETFDSADEAVPDSGDCEIRQEIRIVAGGANLRVETDSGVEIDLPQLHLAPGEAAGVRLCVRGFEAGVDIHEIGGDDVAVEHHLLQLWRA